MTVYVAALGLVSLIDRARRPRVPGPSVRNPVVHGGHGSVAHFFSAMPWIAWPLVALAVLAFLVLLPSRLFGSVPWYVRLGLLASAATGLLLWRRRRKNIASARL